MKAMTASRCRPARRGLERSQRLVGVLLTVLALAAWSARSAEAANAHIPPRPVVVPVKTTAVPITVSGDVAYESRNNLAAVDARLNADLANLQQRSTEVLRAVLDRSADCGDRIAIRNGTLGAQKPALKVAAAMDYEKTACFGANRWTLVPRSQMFVDILLHPVVQTRSLRFRAEVLEVRSATAPIEGNTKEMIKTALGALISEEIGELFPKDAVAYDAVLKDLTFEEAPGGRLTAKVAGSGRMAAATLQALLKGASK